MYRSTFLWNSVDLLEFITNGLSIYSSDRLVTIPINLKLDCTLRCNIHKLFRPSAAKSSGRSRLRVTLNTFDFLID